MPIYSWAFAAALIVSLVLTPAVILLANKTGAMDAPNARKVHTKPIPRIGGLAIYAGFMAAVAFVAVKFGLNPDDGCREMTMEEYRRAKTSVVTLAPEAARKKIYAGAKEAVERLTKAPESFTYADNLEPPYVLETEYRPAEHGGEIRKERKEHPTSFSALMRM